MKNFITIALLLVFAGPGFAIDKDTILRKDGSLNKEAAQRSLNDIELARIVLVKALPDDREGGPLPFGTYFFMEESGDFLIQYMVFRRTDEEKAVESWLDRLAKALDEGFGLERTSFWTKEELRQDYVRMKKGGDPHGILASVRDVWPPNENYQEREMVLHQKILLREEYWKAKITLVVADHENALAVMEPIKTRLGGMQYSFLQFRRMSRTSGPKEWIVIGHGAPLAKRVDLIDTYLARFPEAIIVDGNLPEFMVPKQ